MLVNDQVRRAGRRKEPKNKNKKPNEYQRGAVSSARSEEESTQLRPHSTRPPSDIHPSLKALNSLLLLLLLCVFYSTLYSPHCGMTLVRYRRRPLSPPNPPFWLSTIAKGSRRRNKTIRRIKKGRTCAPMQLDGVPQCFSASSFFLPQQKKKNQTPYSLTHPTNSQLLLTPSDSYRPSTPLLFFSSPFDKPPRAVSCHHQPHTI